MRQILSVHVGYIAGGYMRIIYEKPKTKWQKRKEKLLNTWKLFAETRAGLVGIGILIAFVVMVLAASFLL